MEPMQSDRIHRARSADGTEIAGRVFGEGPPLVLVHGGFGDGETSWRFLVPHLQHYTCYCPSLRSRGLSAEHPDHSTERLIGDIVAFVDSIGEPVGLFGHSSGGGLALAAATRAEQVAAVAGYEPALPEMASEGLMSSWRDATARITEAAGDGRLADAAQIGFEGIALVNDEENAAIRAAGATEIVAPNMPPFLRDVEGFLESRILELDRLTAPVLVLEGTRTHDFYSDLVGKLREQVSDIRVRRVEGAGHMGPLLAAEPVAAELTAFFTDVLTRA